MHVVLQVWFAMGRRFYYGCVTVATYIFTQKMENISIKNVIRNFHVLKKVPFY